MNTIMKLENAMIINNSLVCCGIDPDLQKMPWIIQTQKISDEEKVKIFLKEVINITSKHVCAYKLQKAFFDYLTNGNELLKEIIDYIHKFYKKIPVFIDCKIGDIRNTSRIYFKNLFQKLNADGVVINPYMGDDIFLESNKYKKKVLIVLIKTSNPGGKIVQNVAIKNKKKLWEYLLEVSIKRWNNNRNIVPVLSQQKI